MVKTNPPADIIGRPLSNSAVPTRYGITVVATKRPGEGFTHATAETVVEADDTIIVTGRTRATEHGARSLPPRPGSGRTPPDTRRVSPALPPVLPVVLTRCERSPDARRTRVSDRGCVRSCADVPLRCRR
ncbi:TrkA C-terminal domain-containing protein [Streptomyces rochei]|uniref:TrkA C-terminal domain-containing protein n=1 Tax=Streptomyces rochei TaxID=1928 RepID=UPI0020CA6AFA